MSRMCNAARGCALAIGLALAAGAAQAAPGDIHAVTSERVNLRSGPSEQASIRSTITGDDRLIELRRDGNWVGVRVVDTGEEGWVFGDLLRRQQASTLGGAEAGATRADAGFNRLSPGFDRLIADIGDQFGYRFADSVEQTGDNTLRVVPTEEWIYNTSREAKLYAALAVYAMWKNYNNGRPVEAVLGPSDGHAIMVSDRADGPELSLPLVGGSR
ncbi:SH3 domain-containing protein [Azospirillum halopraeferens]|uniref:SH3 domain-containing protein n=1 Tax=Azospirillum halopraeferens TaxID=34010 RepID=UPI00040FF00D|nr:SH3 domain-containing protein [Azospirillum halopraeferens]